MIVLILGNLFNSEHQQFIIGAGRLPLLIESSFSLDEIGKDYADRIIAENTFLTCQF